VGFIQGPAASDLGVQGPAASDLGMQGPGEGLGQGRLHLQGFTLQQGHWQVSESSDVGPGVPFPAAIPFGLDLAEPKRRPSRIKTKGIQRRIHPSVGPLLSQM